MNTVRSTHSQPPIAVSQAAPGFLQRACECGGKAGASGTCQDCDREQLTGLQPKLTVSGAHWR